MNSPLPPYTPSQARAARAWLVSACDFAESVVSLAYIRNEAPDADCVACVVASYDGGWDAFLAAMEPAQVGKEVAA